MCEQKGGISFKNNLLDDNQCCKKASFVNNKCPADGLIDTSSCTKGTLADKIVGFVTKHWYDWLIWYKDKWYDR